MERRMPEEQAATNKPKRSVPLPDRQILENLLKRIGGAEKLINAQLRDIHALHGHVLVLVAAHDNAREIAREIAAGEIVPLKIIERRAIFDALALMKGDKLKTAVMLGIGKTKIYRKLKEYGY